MYLNGLLQIVVATVDKLRKLFLRSTGHLHHLVKMFNAHGASFVIGKQVYVDGHPGEAAMGGTLTAAAGTQPELPPLETYPLY